MEDNSYKEVIGNVVQKLYGQAVACSMKKSRLLPQSANSCRSCDEPLDHIREARMSWECGILEELRAIVHEAKRPFLLVRGKFEKSPFLEPSGSTGMQGSEKEKDKEGVSAKFLFDSEDLMETVLALRNSNLRPAQLAKSPGLLQLGLPGLALEQLPRRFPELCSAHMQLGLDELQSSAQGLKLLAARHEEGDALLNAGPGGGQSMRKARLFMRKGVPPSLRGRIWRLACGLSEKSTPSEERRFARLRHEVDRLDLVTDQLLMDDLQTVLDDPRFFVFEEELKEVLLAFSRDGSVRSEARYEIHAPWLQAMGAEDLAAPPCAVQPYLGFSAYFAPFCYLYKHKASLFHVTRHLYCELWCKLNVLSSAPDTLPALCQSFESLLLESHPRLFLHLVSLGVQPLRVAFPWMQLAFVGLLEIDQLLHLWERVIGYMDPSLLAVAAVCIFLYRADMLLRVSIASSRRRKHPTFCLTSPVCCAVLCCAVPYVVCNGPRRDGGAARRLSSAHHAFAADAAAARRTSRQQLQLQALMRDDQMRGRYSYRRNTLT